MNYASKNYPGPSVDYRDTEQGEDFLIWDRPGERRLMISRSVGAAFVQGFGMSAGTMPSVMYERGALNWLRTQGRDCTVTRSFLVVEPQYEVQYDCQPLTQ